MKSKSLKLPDFTQTKLRTKKMEEENRPPTQRSTCTGRIVRTEEAIIVVENTGESNVHTQHYS